MGVSTNVTSIVGRSLDILYREGGSSLSMESESSSV